MPYPIQPVTAFSEAELWYIYQQLIEINANTLGGSLTQNELYEVFNGTNPEGLASSLFESISGGDTPLANLFVETISGNNFSIANETYNIRQYLSSVRTPVLTSITGSLTISVQVHNLSVYNSGAAAGTINVDGGGAISIPAGVTVNYDAGGNNNRYAINKFVLNATGTTFIVSYTA
jgi:hypothetical protein